MGKNTINTLKTSLLVAVADLENFGGGDDKIYEHKLCIISKFGMFMINVLDLTQTWGYF